MKNRDLSALSETALLYCNRTEADIILPKARRLFQSNQLVLLYCGVD
jgi:hypothetical protein